MEKGFSVQSMCSVNLGACIHTIFARHCDFFLLYLACITSCFTRNILSNWVLGFVSPTPPLSVVLRTPVCWFCQSLCSACRRTRRVSSCLCGLASEKKRKKIPTLAVLPQEQVYVGWLKHCVVFFPTPFQFSFSLGRVTELSDLQCEENNDLSVPKQSILWDTLIARCCVLIERRRWYKQENTIGYWQDCTETQVPLTQCSRAHFSTMSQGDRSKHAHSEPKLAWLSSDLVCHPAVRSTVVGHSDSGQYGEKHGFTQISLICFQSRGAPLPLAHPSVPLISHAIDWNSKRWDQVVHNPAFLWIVDWMCWWWLFL